MDLENAEAPRDDVLPGQSGEPQAEQTDLNEETLGADEAADVSDAMEESETDSLAEEMLAEMAALAAETRRGHRRVIDVLKHMAGTMDSVSSAVSDLHRMRTAGAGNGAAAPARGAEESGLFRELVELRDRLARMGAADEHLRPAQPAESSGNGSGWLGLGALVGARRDEGKAAREMWAAWDRAWRKQQDATSIIAAHLDGILARHGLERIEAGAGVAFDPGTMTATEVITGRTDVADHTVVAELLPGWRMRESGRVVRPAHVRVARRAVTASST